MKIYHMYKEIEKEVQRATIQHPNWPTDIFQQLAILNEEAGEVTKAVNDHVFKGKPIDDVKLELIQTGAMCVRMLNNL